MARISSLWCKIPSRGLLIFIMLWLPAFAWFYQQLPTDPQPLPEGAKADAIVVLTGSRGRLETGLELLKENRGRMLFISGVGKGVKLSELAAVNGLDPSDPIFTNEINGSLVVLGRSATDTVGNATETAEWAKKRRIKSMLLVTSYYHIPRSVMEFRAANPGVVIVPYPVFPQLSPEENTALKAGHTVNNWRLILLEFHKYLFRAAYLSLKGQN